MVFIKLVIIKDYICYTYPEVSRPCDSLRVEEEVEEKQNSED